MASSSPGRRLRAAELYSGLGGWRYAALGLPIDVVLAVDHSDQCNTVYAANFGEKPQQRRIESLTAEDLADVDAWLMSPPCQPFTRQRTDSGVDVADPRSDSLRHLSDLVASTPKLRVVCLENVVGFGESQSFASFRRTLLAAGFELRAWHLTPTAIGVPNDRPRFFLCAVRRQEASSPVFFELRTGWPVPVKKATMPLAQFLLEDDDDESWRVPSSVLAEDKGWCLDIVDRESRSTACFTRSYGRFVRGTGSVLLCGAALADLGLERSTPSDRRFDRQWTAKLPAAASLRYLAPREIANLLGFPSTLSFDGMSRRAQWAALGNSLHVDAARAVLLHALDMVSSVDSA